MKHRSLERICCVLGRIIKDGKKVEGKKIVLLLKKREHFRTWNVLCNLTYHAKKHDFNAILHLCGFSRLSKGFHFYRFFFLKNEKAVMQICMTEK